MNLVFMDHVSRDVKPVATRAQGCPRENGTSFELLPYYLPFHACWRLLETLQCIVSPSLRTTIFSPPSILLAMFRVLPSALIVLIIAMLALHAPRAVGKQCKLVYQGAGSYRNPAVTHSPNGSPPASATTWRPFNYGADIVRGVNL
jgi:hypothetical protein